MAFIKQLLLTGLLLVVNQFLLYAQSEDCKKIMIDYINVMNSVKEPEPGKSYHLDMIVKNTMVNNDDFPQQVEIDAILTNSKLVYTSSLMSVYQDTSNAFTVIHPSKTIIWNKGKKSPVADEQQQLILNVKLELLENSSVTLCEKSKVSGKELLIIGIQPTLKVMEDLKIDHFTFYFNSQKKLIEKLVIDYNSEYPLQSQEITYKVLDFDSNNKVLPIKDYLFEKDGRLKSKFQDYKLIDNRS